MSREREIEQLRTKLAKLEAEQAREEQALEALESAHAELLGRLQEADLDLEMFVSRFQKEFRRILGKIDRQSVKKVPAAAAKSRPKKKAVRKRRRKPVVVIKIPAGNYHNIPPETERVYKVGEKGARPKAVKAHAEQLGLEAFLAQCRIDE